MKDTIRLQGRDLSPANIEYIRELIRANPSDSRRKLSTKLCESWGWRNGTGVLKDMASRTLMLKLEARGLITLPARRQAPSNRMTQRRIEAVTHDNTPLEDALRALQPLHIMNVTHSEQSEDAFNYFLSKYHYLDYRSPVGENMKYFITAHDGRPLACILFGSSAWSCNRRDDYINWGKTSRETCLHLTTNNSRFLILPWVKVPHLASHILGLVTRKLSADWQMRYGHPIYLVETFVEKQRFSGTCYRAANWVYVGDTKGRSRNDRHNTLQVPVKSIYLYPLVKHFRKRLLHHDGQ